MSIRVVMVVYRDGSLVAEGTSRSTTASHTTCGGGLATGVVVCEDGLFPISPGHGEVIQNGHN